MAPRRIMPASFRRPQFDDRVLLVMSDLALARRIGAALAGTEADVAETLAAAEARLARNGVAAVVVDLDIAAEPAESIERLRRLFAGPIVAISANGSVGLAVEAVRRGAADFLVKPVAPALLARRLADLAPAVPAPMAHDEPGFEGFVGASPPMCELYAQIGRIAASRAPVFITGESGTGKEVAAAAVHSRSPRSAGPFIALNCSAIPRELIESEIFGHARGAFTGATDDRAGAAELAHGGTLFLDELCEMDLALQAKLLRVIQTGEVRRVGAAAARTVDVRFVCATNRDPRREIEAGRFREDLYYRLHVLPLHLVPLRARGGDVLLLARTFLTRFAAEEGRGFRRLDAAAEACIAAYPWPGNVRQLQNVLRRAVVLNDGERLTADMLPEEIAGTAAIAPPHALPRLTGAAEAPRATGVAPMWLQEQRIIEQALTAFGGNIARAAAALEINPSTIYRKRQSWAQRAAAE
jgi:two-component system repressor protein LuxO